VIAMRQDLPRVQMKTLVATGGRCVECHNEANSPRFDDTDYWHRIAHGGAVRRD